MSLSQGQRSCEACDDTADPFAIYRKIRSGCKAKSVPGALSPFALSVQKAPRSLSSSRLMLTKNHSLVVGGLAFHDIEVEMSS